MLYLSAIISSLLLFTASPGQFFLAPGMWAALLPLLYAIDKCQPKQAAKIGFTCGVFYYTPLLYWILIVLGTYGNLSIFVSGPALLLLAMYMALFLSVFCATIAWAKKALPLFLVAPPLWVALDLIRARLFTGFPWLDLGYSQYQNTTIIQLADIFGHYGVTFLIVLSNCLLFSLLKQHRSAKQLLWQGVAALFVAIAVLAYGGNRIQSIQQSIHSSPKFKTGLVQGNIDQGKKWLPDLQEQTIDTYLSLSDTLKTKAPLDLLIWPETALPFFPIGHPLFSKIKQSILVPDGPFFITGAPHYVLSSDKKTIQYYNSAFVFSPAPNNTKNHQKNIKALSRYDKQHLVPFGEYIPLSRYLPSSTPLVQSMGNFSAGTSLEPISCHNARIGVLICYESIFPDLARKEVKNGANLLVNLTNDAWYGKSSAPWQQLAMAVFRAVENRRSLARAANTGISCFIDPLGRQMALSPLFEPYTMSADLALLEGQSPFVRYGHFFPLLCLLWLLPIALIVKKKNQKTKHN